MKSNILHKVIIIDDHYLFNDGLALILKERSFFYNVIHQVYDSRQGVKKCFELMPDLIIVDFNMPYIDGLELVKELKKNLEWGKKVKIVIISMYSDNKHIRAFKEEGAHAYILKTTPLNEMIETLDKVMEGETFFAGNHKKANSKFKDNFGKKYFLTTQERVILSCLKKGYTSVQMAEELCLSEHTVKTHRKNIKQKLDFKDKGDFLKFLHENEF